MEISHEKHNIDALFSRTAFHIDFYQREYKWGAPEVERLLEDVFYKFEQSYVPTLDVNAEVVERRYPWYYLNTYITNKVASNTYIVDGQQRLTTLSLILIKLYHLSKQWTLPEERCDWLKSRIYGTGAQGKAFWMGQGKRQKVLSLLFDGSAIPAEVSSESTTSANMVKNFEVPSNGV